MKILISSCVLGQNVRWNGTNCLYEDITTWALDEGIELVPVCPEHELFGTPRPPIRLELIGEMGIRGHMGKKDVYRDLMDKSFEISRRYPDAVGFIGIAKSPTCGISVGVRSLGTTIKGAMHAQVPFPSTEINSLRTGKARELFLKRVRKYENR